MESEKRRSVLFYSDCSSLYRVPLLLEEQGVVDTFRERLHLPLPLPTPKNLMSKWRALAESADRLCEPVTIVLVGKYTEFEDSYASVTKALRHAARFAQRKMTLKVSRIQTIPKD